MLHVFIVHLRCFGELSEPTIKLVESLHHAVVREEPAGLDERVRVLPRVRAAAGITDVRDEGQCVLPAEAFEDGYDSELWLSDDPRERFRLSVYQRPEDRQSPWADLIPVARAVGLNV